MKVLITGASGLVGRSFVENIKLPCSYDFVFVGSKDCDLTNRAATFNLFKEAQPESVIHLAAKVGGVKGNTNNVADFYSQNIQMNTNVLDAAHLFKVKKVVSLLSTCVYPDSATYPLTEDQIHKGAPHRSNFGYAYAKRMLDIQSQAYRQQHGCNFITAVPNNLYGPGDNFDIECGHVIPSIIRKVWEAKKEGRPPTFWGSGRALREFTFSHDVAQVLLFLLENYRDDLPINMGKTGEVDIKTIVRKICRLLEYDGEIVWDTSQPEGQFRKPSSNAKFLALQPNFEYTSLDNGLRKTCTWFRENYPNIRGI